jgi:hypothetical protein
MHVAGAAELVGRACRRLRERGLKNLPLPTRRELYAVGRDLAEKKQRLLLRSCATMNLA